MPRSPVGHVGWAALSLVPLTCLALLGGSLADGRGRLAAQDEPEFSLRASPRVALAPAEVLFIGELRGGADDYEEYYCAALEWNWGDDTRSESTPDCEPYEAGTSKIRRRFSMRHRFDIGGRFEVRLHLKRRDDTVASARTTVEIRGGRPFD
jgi:hypothetical protein